MVSRTPEFPRLVASVPPGIVAGCRAADGVTSLKMARCGSTSLPKTRRSLGRELVADEGQSVSMRTQFKIVREFATSADTFLERFESIRLVLSTLIHLLAGCTLVAEVAVCGGAGPFPFAPSSGWRFARRRGPGNAVGFPVVKLRRAQHTVSKGGIIDFNKGTAALIRDSDVGSYIMFWQPPRQYGPRE